MSAAKQKGTAFETSLVPLLDSWYRGAHRAPPAGTNDIGDFILPGEKRFILEAKNRSILALPAWLREAEAEALNAGALAGFVVSKRKGTTRPEDQYVVGTLNDFLLVVNCCPGHGAPGRVTLRHAA